MPFKNYSAATLIGRETEVNAVVAAASAAASGDACSLYLAGGKGTGKTEILRHACGRLFNEQDEILPFFYTVKTAFSSIDNFSRDFLSSYILQALAFIRKEPSLASSMVYTMDDLRGMADKLNVSWCSDLIERYFRLNDDGDMMKLFAFIISAPDAGRSSGGLPAAVVIDDFHKIRKLCELNAAEGGSRLWLLFENLLKSRTTPHIVTGYAPELQKMFFEDSSIGEDLEIMYIRGLAPEDAAAFFEALCSSGGVDLDSDARSMIGRFRGSPYYIRSFVQAARHAGAAITSSDFDDIYFNEVTHGKLFTYWVSALKHHMPHFDMRRPALRFLDHIIASGPEHDLSSLSGELELGREQLDSLIDMLVRSGALDSGFSTLEVSDDPVFRDVLKGLLLRELKSRGREEVKRELVGERPEEEKVPEPETPMFEFSIPARKSADMVAVRSVEHVAAHYGLSGGITGQLQMALVEMFSILSGGNGAETGTFRIGIGMEDGVFSVVVNRPAGGPVSDTIRHDLNEIVGHYVDSVIIDDEKGLSRIVLRKSANGIADSD